MFLTRTTQKAKTMNTVVSVRVRDAARPAFIAVDTDQQSLSLPLVLTA